jgi:hypothetical protein
MKLQYLKDKIINYSKSKLFWSIIAYLIVSISFIIAFKFVDIANFRAFLYNTSYLYLNQNPYVFDPQPFPPNFYSFLVPAFLVYIYSGNNLFFYIDFIKFFQMFISIFSSILIYKIIVLLTNSEKRGISAFYAFLFSPMFFLVNYVETEQSTIGIFFALISIYIFLLSEKFYNYDYIFIMSASILLWYSVFLYYFPIIIIPSLLIFQKNIKNFLKVSISLLLGFLFFYLPTYISHFWEIFSNLWGAGGPIESEKFYIPLFSILQLFTTKNPSNNIFLSFVYLIFTILFIVIVFLIPVLFRIFKRSMFSSISLIFIFLFLLIRITNVDEFIWIIPFITIALALQMKERFLTLKLFLSQVYYLPFFIIFNLWGAPGFGSGTGIFYLSYLQFQKSIEIFHFFTDPIALTKILIFIGFIFLIIIIHFIVHDNRNNLNLSKKVKKNSILIYLKNFNNFIFILSKVKNIKLMYIKKKFNNINIVFSLGLVLIFIFGSLNIGYSDQTIIQKNSDFPLGLFNSYPVMNGTYSYNYTNNNKAVMVAPTNYSLYWINHYPSVFSRNLSGENLNMNMSVYPINTNNVPYNVTIIKMFSANINLLNKINFPKDSKILSPSNIRNCSISYDNLPFVNQTFNLPFFRLNGTSVINYHLKINYSNKYYFLFHSDIQKWSQNQVMLIYYNGLQVQFFSPGNSNNYILSYNDPSLGPNWSTKYVYAFQDNYWNLVSFYFTNNSLVFNMNNLKTQVINYNFSNNPIIAVFLGKYGYYTFSNYRFSLKGDISSIISSNENLTFNDSMLYLKYFDFNKYVYVSKYINYNNESIYLKYSNETFYIFTNGYDIQVKNFHPLIQKNNSNIYFPEFDENPIIKFGRLSNSSIYLVFKINYINISSHNPSTLFNIISLSIITPIYVITYISIYNFKKRKNKIS